jgi:hypothetical protein
MPIHRSLKNLINLEMCTVKKSQKSFNLNIFLRFHKKKKVEFHFYQYIHCLQIWTKSVQKSGFGTCWDKVVLPLNILFWSHIVYKISISLLTVQLPCSHLFPSVLNFGFSNTIYIYINKIKWCNNWCLPLSMFHAIRKKKIHNYIHYPELWKSMVYFFVYLQTRALWVCFAI